MSVFNLLKEAESNLEKYKNSTLAEYYRGQVVAYKSVLELDTSGYDTDEGSRYSEDED